MAIDPKLYEKYSGRSGDPMRRLGEVLAKDARAKQERSAMPKGVRGGFRTTLLPGIWAQLFFWMKDKSRYKGD